MRSIRNQRKMIMKEMFEALDTPAMYFEDSSVLHAFSMGKSNALVIDSGARRTVFSAVMDGCILRRNTFIEPFGSEHLVDIAQNIYTAR